MNSQSLNTILDAVQGFQKSRSGGGGGGGGGSSSSKSKGEPSGGPLAELADLQDRLEDIEERVKVVELCDRNSRAWQPHHRLERIKVLIREEGKKGAAVYKWVGHPEFPKTVMAFKMLQHNPRRVRNLLEFYNVVAYQDDEDDDAREPRRVDLSSGNKLRDVEEYIEPCLESLAIAFGIDWQKINGLEMSRRGGGGPRAPPSGGGGGGGPGPRSRPQSFREEPPDYRDKDRDRDRDRDRSRDR